LCDDNHYDRGNENENDVTYDDDGDDDSDDVRVHMTSKHFNHQNK